MPWYVINQKAENIACLNVTGVLWGNWGSHNRLRKTADNLCHITILILRKGATKAEWVKQIPNKKQRSIPLKKCRWKRASRLFFWPDLWSHPGTETEKQTIRDVWILDTRLRPMSSANLPPVRWKTVSKNTKIPYCQWTVVVDCDNRPYQRVEEPSPKTLVLPFRVFQVSPRTQECLRGSY